MRLQHGLPARHLARDTVYLGGDIEITLRAKEIAGLRPADAAHEAKGGVQPGLGAARREVEVLAATLGVEAGSHRDGFDQGGLTAAVLADEEGYFWMQIERVERANCRSARRSRCGPRRARHSRIVGPALRWAPRRRRKVRLRAESSGRSATTHRTARAGWSSRGA